MTRPLSAPLLAEMGSATPFIGECLILAAADGTRAGFTTLDTAQAIDLGFGAGVETCDSGMNLSAVTLAVGLDASFAEVQGPLGPVLTQAAIDGGKWDDADAWLVQVAPGITGYAPILAGKVREARGEDPRFVLEIRNVADAINQELGEVFTPYCKAQLGDAQCTFALVPILATITAITDAMRFSVSYSGTFATDYFNSGKIIFTSGDLTGVVSDALHKFTSGGAGGGELILFEPLTEAPQIGDTLDLFQGCAKSRAACISFHGDARPFRGHPDMPGTEQVLKAPNPGSGG